MYGRLPRNDGGVRFDEVLTRNEGIEVLAELKALRRPGPVVVTGVRQERVKLSQFRFVLDQDARAWSLDRDDGSHQYYRDGQLHGPDGLHDVAFENGMPAPVHMAMPELLRWWGRGRESFAPVLVQRVGSHSLLITFEHDKDPAFRTTLVVDERNGIARRRMELGDVTAVTDVRAITPSEPSTAPAFEPIIDWIPPDY